MPQCCEERMGRVKDWDMEQEARGWWSVPGKYVCSECFEEDFLSASPPLTIPKLRTWVRFPSPAPDSLETNHLRNTWLHFSTWLQFNYGMTFDVLGQRLYRPPLRVTHNMPVFLKSRSGVAMT